MMLDFDEDGSIQALSGFDLQSTFPYAAEEVVSLARLSEDQELAKHGLNVYMMTEELNISIPEELLEELKQLTAKESRPVKSYSGKPGTPFADLLKEWEAQTYLYYLELGSRKPEWDQHAVSLLAPRVGPHPDGKKLAESLLKTDCNDPVVLTRCANRLESAQEILETLNKASALLDSSAYPPHVKFKIRLNHLRLIEKRSRVPKDRADAVQQVEKSLLEALLVPNLTNVARRMLNDYFYGLRSEGQFETPFRNPKELVAREGVDPWVREMLMGYYHRRIAWEAAGDGMGQYRPGKELGHLSRPPQGGWISLLEGLEAATQFA